VNTPDGLQLLGGVEDGLHEQDVGGLGQVEAPSPGVDGQQQDCLPCILLERLQVRLETEWENIESHGEY